MTLDEEVDRISYDDLVAVLRDAFVAHGVREDAADLVARNCASCERDGSTSHGVFRMPGYLASLEDQWLDGNAQPKVEQVSPSYIRVDGAYGFAQVALEAVKPHIAEAVAETGIALVAMRDVHHFSSLWPDVEPFARQGLVALTMVAGGNPSVVPPGTTERLFGTNPISFATPRADAAPVVWDFATSTMSHGDLTIAHEEGRKVPVGRGVGEDGRDTEDPGEIIHEGGLIPFGGHKGALIMLMVEMLSGALGGAAFSTEADEGKPEGAITSRVGQLVVVIDPERGNPSDYQRRIADFIEMLRESGMERIPGERRYRRRDECNERGIPITDIMREFFATL